ncbi:MAG: PAS domain S-box protein [Betaproteobacteria bacterium]|nr:PAS domain S-box protein [Betaproteobacteria bacterium]
MGNPLQAFLRLFLPLSLAIMGAAYLYIGAQREARLNVLKADEMLSVKLGATVLDRRTQIVRSDLEYLAHHNAIFDSPKSNGEPDLVHMERSLKDFLHSRPVYDKMSWIDASGQERLRVNMRNGQPVSEVGENLRSKADNRHFIEAMRLRPGEQYLSPAELSTENGAIELPHKPVIRFATPLADSQGKTRGILMLNYLADEMLAFVEMATPRVRDRLMVLTTAGYFMHSPTPTDDWGFMFDDTQRSLPSRFPDVWAKMQDDHGQFVDADGLWTYQTVYPLLANYRNISDIHSTPRLPQNAAEGARRWRVATRMPTDRLTSLLREGEQTTYAYLFVLQLLLAAGVAALVRSDVRQKATEQRFRVFFDNAMVGMGIVTPDGTWLAVNPALCATLGCAAEDLLHKPMDDISRPDNPAIAAGLFEQAMHSEDDEYEAEKHFQRADGQSLDVFIATRVIRKRDGNPDYLLVVIDDITQRVIAEQQRQKSLETLTRFIDYLPGMAYIKDSETRILVANNRFQEMLGLPHQEVIGRLTEAIFPGDLGRRFAAADRRIMANGQAEIFEEKLGGKVYETIKFPIPHDDAPSELGGITMDITRRKQNEQMLALQTSRATALLALPSRSQELDEQDFLTYVLEVAGDLTGSPFAFLYFVTPEEDNITLANCLPGRPGPGSLCSLSAAGSWADAARLQHPVTVNESITLDPDIQPCLDQVELSRLISVPILDNDKVRILIALGNKALPYGEFDSETLQLLGNETWRIVRQQRADNALKIANQVVNASPVVCFRWAASDGWPVVFASENVVQWGYSAEELQAGKPAFAELLHPDDQARITNEVAAHRAAGCTAYEQEYRIITRDNRTIWVMDRTTVRRDSNGTALFYDGVLTDISDRKMQQMAVAANLAEQKTLNKKLEEAHNQLLQSEKMASIGQLAAGIAHELNNPIGFVHSNLGTLDGYIRDLMEIIARYDELAQASENPAFVAVKALKEERDFNYIAEDIGQLLSESKEGLSRVRKIVLDLKNFSHVSEQEWQWADLHQGLDSTLNIVWNELKYKCQVIKEYGELPKVHCMISQLNQVFMNLLVNAGHAIETKGTITIHTSLLDDGQICIEIRDTGKGIAPEHMQRIFEPFFTTKPVGKGTGLGLSLSYGIVEKHHGRIEVDSVLGQGSTFRIILPVNQTVAPSGPSTEISA